MVLGGREDLLIGHALADFALRLHLGGGIEFNAGVRGGSRRPYLHTDVSMGGRARLYHGEKFTKLAADPLDLFAHGTAGRAS